MFVESSRPATSTGEPPRRLREAWIALAGLAAVFLVEMLDNSILTVALPTIGRDLDASTTDLQLVTSAYSIVFGGLMLALSALADRVGRRRIMLAGLALLAVASLSTAVVTTPGQLIAVRAAMGVAAAMTTPGSLALAFRLFDDDALRVRATTVISTVGLVGLAVGPTAGGLALSVVPWQALLIVNTPIAVVALVCIRIGIQADDPADLHRDPIDVAGAALGTLTIVLALVAPTLFVESGTGSWVPWAALVAAVVAAVAFVARERTAAHPLLDLELITRPLVASGLLLKSATGLATAGLGYLVTLQLQLDLGWTATQAAIGMLPQVIVLIAGGALIGPLVRRVGMDGASWAGALAVVGGLGVFAVLGRSGYGWIALALVLVAAGMRVVGVVAGTNVLRGLPSQRTTIGAALVDTASEVTSAAGIAISGTILAATFAGSIVDSGWTAAQADQFRTAVRLGSAVLTVMAAALVGVGIAIGRASAPSSSAASRRRSS